MSIQFNEKIPRELSELYNIEEKCVFSPDTEVYHYTSPKGLLGILGKDGTELRFSRFDCVNDTSEGQNIVQTYKAVCDLMFDKGLIPGGFYRSIRDLSLMQTAYFTFYSDEMQTIGSVSECEKYICCFSRDQDSLPMWNYYTKGVKYEGYNIGFRFPAWTDNSPGRGYDLKFCDVIYDDEEKHRLLVSFISKVWELYRDERLDMKTVCDVLEQELANLSLVFKKQCFSHESEVRAVLTVPKSYPDTVKDVERFEVKYHAVNGYIVPYIPIKVRKEDVSSVTIGPILNKQLAGSTLRAMLSDRGYGGEIRILHSDIPIRF